MKATKAAPHRTAIQEAAKIANPAASGTTRSSKSSKGPPPSMKLKASPASASTGSIVEDLNRINFTTGPTGDPTNDDYEGCKVHKAKKSTYDHDIQSVQDLDRWG